MIFTDFAILSEDLKEKNRNQLNIDKQDNQD